MHSLAEKAVVLGVTKWQGSQLAWDAWVRFRWPELSLDKNLPSKQKQQNKTPQHSHWWLLRAECQRGRETPSRTAGYALARGFATVGQTKPGLAWPDEGTSVGWLICEVIRNTANWFAPRSLAWVPFHALLTFFLGAFVKKNALPPGKRGWGVEGWVRVVWHFVSQGHT